MSAGNIPSPIHSAEPNDSKQKQADVLSSCVHCGFCLEACPTYRLTGDENNSPRGRLRLWRAEELGELPPDPWTDFYTSECIGCLACETACPAKVPYGAIMEQVRHKQVIDGRQRPIASVRIAALLIRQPSLLNAVFTPLRAIRKLGMQWHKFVFPGRPAVATSTAAYAARLMHKYRPNGPRVALLTGCLMEALFRELNFATVRVLIENNIQVVVPAGQTCCGAFLEHAGIGGIEPLQARNRRSFDEGDFEAVLCNSSGCGLSLSKNLSNGRPVRDVLDYLGDRELVVRPRPKNDATKIYVDLPCHLIHGQKKDGIPSSVLDATGYRWQLAPLARDCCGSGGFYNLQKPQNARDILARKADFLNAAVGDPCVLATSNHVCMMQWFSALRSGLVTKPFEVRHVIQLLDPLNC